MRTKIKTWHTHTHFLTFCAFEMTDKRYLISCVAYSVCVVKPSWCLWHFFFLLSGLFVISIVIIIYFICEMNAITVDVHCCSQSDPWQYNLPTANIAAEFRGEWTTANSLDSLVYINDEQWLSYERWIYDKYWTNVWAKWICTILFILRLEFKIRHVREIYINNSIRIVQFSIIK